MTWTVVAVLGHDLASRGPRDNVLHGGGCLQRQSQRGCLQRQSQRGCSLASLLCASVSTSVHYQLKRITWYIYTDTEEGRSLVILCLRVIKYRPRPYSFPG